MPERIELTRHTLGPFEENCYLLVGPSGRKAAIVDPGLESESILGDVRAAGLDIEWIINTHAHLDHVAANRFWKDETGAPLILHAADLPLLDNLVSQGKMFGFDVPESPPPDQHFVEGVPFVFDGVELEVVHTPGHSPGGVCLRFGDRMLVGDTLFQGSVGRTDLPGGSAETLIDSIRGKLFRFPDEVVCYPGHGETTTLGDERRANPFVGDRAPGLPGGES